MCGRFNLIDSSEVRSLCDALGVEIPGSCISQDIAPGSRIAIIHENLVGRDKHRKVSEATWWLLLERKTLKPNYRYASFNSRSDKLHKLRGISYVPYRESRCIIPASAFVENLGDKKIYHMIELAGSAIAFGGLYMEYRDRQTGERVHSASIITLPPLSPQWDKIHPKSMPLILDLKDDHLISKWLDPNFKDVDQFARLLEPRVHSAMKITRIGKPNLWNPIEDAFTIAS